MVEKVVLKGRGAVGGIAEGEAIVSSIQIHTFGIDPKTGLITEIRNPQRGMSVKGKVLVFSSPAGSSDWGTTFYDLNRNGKGPIALINRRASTLVLNGAIATSTPMIVDFDEDPCMIIETGDWLKVDANHGIVEIYKR
jgi:predicted aconitase with swiveling domain